MRKLSCVLGVAVAMCFLSSGLSYANSKRPNESQIKSFFAPAKKVQVTPVQAAESKDLCEVMHAGPPAFCVSDWIEQGHSYASYQDPLEAGCITPYPFQVMEIHFWVCATAPLVTEIYVDVLEANLEDPACPYPGLGIFTSGTYLLDLPAPGNYDLALLLAEKVCVDAPYFVGFNFPAPVVGLGPITDNTPQGCQDYIWFDVSPLDLVTQVGFPGNVLLYSVGLTSSENACSEYPPPLAAIIQPRDTAWYDQTYFSDSVRITVDDTSDGSRIDHVSFEYLDPPTGIWYPIGTDYDGTDVWYNSWDTSQVGGDGWSYVWVEDGLPEDYYVIRATMTDSMGRSASDTKTIYYDPNPPIPNIIKPESTGVYCSPIEVIYTLQADHIADVQSTIYNWSDGWYSAPKDSAADSTYNKGIPSMRQDTLTWWGKDRQGRKVNAGCVPTAATACLTWWAGHGFPGITGGLDAKGLADSLASKDYFKTSPSTGTKSSKVTTGLDRWLINKLGFCVFKYPLYENNRKKITFDLYAREIKREDIIIGWGGEPWHATTGNSATAQSSTYDVMNPATGNIETYAWPQGAGNARINQIWIISPKVQPQPPPGTPGPTGTQYQQEGQYRMVWHPDTTLTPYNKWYTFEVTVTDSLGHVGRDMFHFELADYVCGDANGDGITDLGDAIYELNYLFKGGETPDPFEAGDANCDGMLDLGDAIYLLNYLFREGPYPGCF